MDGVVAVELGLLEGAQLGPFVEDRQAAFEALERDPGDENVVEGLHQRGPLQAGRDRRQSCPLPLAKAFQPAHLGDHGVDRLYPALEPGPQSRRERPGDRLHEQCGSPVVVLGRVDQGPGAAQLELALEAGRQQPVHAAGPVRSIVADG